MSPKVTWVTPITGIVMVECGDCLYSMTRPEWMLHYRTRRHRNNKRWRAEELGRP